jgi:hypothetical protein
MTDPEPEPFVCPFCGFKSYNPNDKRERYCVRCHVFIDDEADCLRERVEAALDALA